MTTLATVNFENHAWDQPKCPACGIPLCWTGQTAGSQRCAQCGQPLDESMGFVDSNHSATHSIETVDEMICHWLGSARIIEDDFEV